MKGYGSTIATMWVLRRGESTVSCSLLSADSKMLVRVSMDGGLLRSEICDSRQRAVQLGELWRTRMMDRGWRERR
jgi:hypothetical protein